MSRGAPKKRSKWGNYLEKGLEVGAIAGVQFVPGLDVVADAALAGEAAEGALAASEVATTVASTGETAAVAGETVASEASLYSKANNMYNKSQDLYNKGQVIYNQYGSRNNRYQLPHKYRRHTTQIAKSHNIPEHHKEFLGPLQKKILIYSIIFILVLIILIIIFKTI